MNNQPNEARRQQVRAEGTGWLQALLRIAQNAMTMPRDELLREVAATACYLLNGVVSIVWTLDKSKEVFRIAAWAGEIDEDYRTQVTFSARATATDEFLKGRRSIYLSDVTDAKKAPFYTAGHRAEAQRRGWVSLLSAPMIAEEQVVGILDVYTDRVRRFTLEDRDLLNTFASQAALAVRHAEVEEQRVRMLSNLQEISALSLVSERETEQDIQKQFADTVVKAVHSLTGDDVAIWLPDETRRQWKIWAHVGLRKEHVERARVGSDDSVSGQAMRTHQPIALFDISDPRHQPPFKYLSEADKMGWQSVMIVPLVTPERALGTLSVYSHSQRDFAQWEQDLLSTFANHAAIAFESVRRQQYLEDLVRIGEAVTRETAAGLRPLLEEAARSACELTGADYAVLYPYDPHRQLFYDLENVVAYGLEKPRYPKEKPRERGLAAVVRDVDELVVHDIEAGELGPLDFGRIREPGIDETRLLEFIREEKFIQEEEVKSLVGLSLKAGPSTNGKEQEVGVLYIDFCRPHHFTEEDLDLIRIFGHQVGSAIQNAHLLERERRLRRQAETLREVSSAISSQIELKEVAERILDELGKVVEYRKASIQLVQGDIRTLIAGRGFDEKAVNEWFLRPISQDPLIQRIVTRNEPLILSDPSKDVNWEIRHETANIKSWAGLPLVYGKETLGLLTLDHDQTGYYTDATRELLTLFCNQAAIAIRNARLHADLERQIKRLQTLNQVSRELSSKLDDASIFQAVVKAVLITLDCTHCTAFVLENDILVPRASYGKDEDVRITRCFAWGEGIAGWVAKEGRAVLAQDAKKHERFREGETRPDAERSIIVVPVTVSGQVIGVISTDQDRVNAFDERDLQMVEAIALQAGSALQNTRLLKQERQRAEAMDLLQRVSARISERLDVGETLRIIIEGAMQLTGTDSGVIHLVDIHKPALIRSYEFPEGFGHPLSRFSQRTGTTWMIVSTGQIVAVPDITGDSRVNPQMAKKGVKALIGVPLSVEREAIGALFLNDSQPREFTDFEKVLLSTLADHAAVAIRNARLYDQRTRDVSALAEINAAIREKDLDDITQLIADKAAKSMGAEYCVLRLVDSSNQYLEPKATSGRRGRKDPLPIDDTSFTGWVASQKKAELCPDVSQGEHYLKWRADVKSCMAAPLLYKGRLVGTLYVESIRLNAFSEESQLALLQAFADQAAIAIENAGLFQELDERAARLVRLQEVTTTISAEPSDLEKVLCLIVDSLSAIFPGASCGIRRYDSKRDEFLQRVVSGLLKDRPDHTPRAEGTSRYVIKTKAPRYLENTLVAPSDDGPALRQEVIKLGVRANACLPLLSKGDIIGVLYVDLTKPHHFSRSDRQILKLFADQAAIAIDNARLFEELNERARRLTRLQEVTASISAEPSDLEKLLDVIVHSLKGIFLGASCVIRLYDANTDEFGLWVAAGVPKERVGYPPRRDGTSRYLVNTKVPRYIEDTSIAPHDGGPAISEKIVRQGVKAAVHLPLLSKGDVTGILYVNLEQPHRFSQNDKQILELFASQAAVAIENAKLYEQRAKDIAALQEINEAVVSKGLEEILELVVEQTVAVMPGEYAELWFKEPATGDLVLRAVWGPGEAAAWEIARLKAGEASINVRVAETGEPCICTDAAKEAGFYRIYKEAQSSVTVPLKYGGEVIGTLNVESCQLNAFTDQHSRLLDSFADQAAIAIENTRLFQELDERAGQLVRLQEVTTTISAEPSDLEKVLDLILENLSKIFQGASCAIRLYDSKPDQFKPLKATGVLEGLADRSPRRNGTSRYAVKTKAPRYLEGEALVRPLDEGPAVRQELVKKGVKAFAYLPLISKGDVIGILYVALVEAYRFSQNDKEILKLFADQAAIAIENARLFERIQELRIIELETLSQLGDDLAALEQAF